MKGQSKHRRVWTYGSSTLLSSLFFLGILAFIALIAERHPWRVDMTESGTFTLSEQTQNILNTLNQPIDIKAFFATASPEQVKAKDLLETFRYASPKVTYEFIDPDRQPEIAKRYEVRTYGTVILEGYGKRQSVQNADEENITNALLKLIRNEQKVIYFLVGHGEHSLENDQKDGYSVLRDALEKENYHTSDLNLLQKAEVPEDSAVLIIAGPRKSLFPQEIATLENYLKRGGKLMILLDPNYDGGLGDVLKKYGLKLDSDMVIDKLSRVFGGSYLMPVVMEYGEHKVTANFDLATFYPEARSVEAVEEPPTGVELEVLASTSENAWAEHNIDMLNRGEASFDEKEDKAGPVSLAVLAEIDLKAFNQGADNNSKEEPNQKAGETKADPANKKAFLLVVGDSDFASNSYFGLSGNGDLFLNMVNFLAEEEHLITIKPREHSNQPVLMTQTQAWIVFWVVLVIVPVVVLLAGLSVYRVRRAQR